MNNTTGNKSARKLKNLANPAPTDEGARVGGVLQDKQAIDNVIARLLHLAFEAYPERLRPVLIDQGRNVMKAVEEHTVGMGSVKEEEHVSELSGLLRHQCRQLLLIETALLEILKQVDL